MISLEDAWATVAAKTAPRVTKEGIEAKLREASYAVIGTSTVCVLTLENGFRVVGHSAPADARNFDKDVGERYAYEDAFRQIWQLEGYLLRTFLHEASKKIVRPDDTHVGDASGSYNGTGSAYGLGRA
jgi:hypothetical protein